MNDLIGIEFVDFSSSGSVRKTQAIIENRVYAPIVQARGIFEDRDFDGDCMFSIEFIESIIEARKSLGCNVEKGLPI